MMRKNLMVLSQFPVTEDYLTTDKQDQNYISDFDKAVKQLKKKS